MSRVKVKQALVEQGMYRERGNSHLGWPNHTGWNRKGCPAYQGHFEDIVSEKKAGLESEAY